MEMAGGLDRGENGMLSGFPASVLNGRPFKRYLLFTVFGLAGAALVLFSTHRYGPGLSPDSTVYISVARNIADGAGATVYDGSEFVLQPPVYPLILSAGLFTASIDPLILAPWINALAFGCILFMTGMLLFSVTRSPGSLILGMFLALWNRALFDISVMAWTEPVFICLALSAILFLERYREKPSWRNLVFPIILIGGACLTRYIGAALIFYGMVVIVAGSPLSPMDRLRRGLVFAAGCGLPLAMWSLRTLAFTGTFFGPRGPSPYTAAQNLLFLYKGILSLFLPDAALVHTVPLVLAGIAVTGILVAAGSRSAFRSAFAALFSRWRIFPLFIVIYCALLMYLSSTSGFDPMNRRLLSPIAVPAIISLVAALETLKKAGTGGKPVQYAAVGVLCMGIALSFLMSAHDAASCVRRGAGGFNSSEYRDSEIIRFVRGNSDVFRGKSVVYSNAPDAVYILADLPCRRVPLQNTPASGAFSPPPEMTAAISRAGAAYVIWVNVIDNPRIWSLDDVRQAFGAAPVRELNDGSVWMLRKK